MIETNNMQQAQQEAQAQQETQAEQIVPVNENAPAVASIHTAAALAEANTNTAVLVFSSIITDDKESRKRFYNAVNGDVQKIGDYIGKTITVKDIVVQNTTVTDTETGLVEAVVKSTLVDVDGVAYCAFSKGIFTSIRNIFDAFGTPDEWDEPLTVEVKQVTRGKFKSLVLNVQ